MSNPFDQNFFKFLLSFSFIIFMSFVVLFFVGRYSLSIDEEATAVLSSM